MFGSISPSSQTDYVQGYFRKRIFQRETLACRCGQHVITAPVPDETQYGPGFLAHLVVSKYCDPLPLYRMGQQFGRLGIPKSRRTITGLFHRAGELVALAARRSHPDWATARLGRSLIGHGVIDVNYSCISR